MAEQWKITELTALQQVAIDRLLTQWTTVSEPRPMPGGGGCVMVEVQGETTENTMTLGIETDGYTHS